jgi:predicted HD superfamily hydrolase involved in NAD metabolism
LRRERKNKELESLRLALREHLGEELYGHSLRVAETAKQMAQVFGEDTFKAYNAGLLHDYAKVYQDNDLLVLAQKYGYKIIDVERLYPYLLHAQISAKLVAETFQIDDSELLSAIEKHTLGSVRMSRLDKILYIADMIEPGRRQPELDSIRALARENLELAFKEAYAHTLYFLIRSRKLIHPQAIDVWNWIVKGDNAAQ